MHARHVMMQKSPADIEDSIGAFRANVYEVLRGCDGFVGIAYLIDRESGETIGMSFWDTEANMQASGEVLHAAREERLKASGDTGQEGSVTKHFMELALFETS